MVPTVYVLYCLCLCVGNGPMSSNIIMPLRINKTLGFDDDNYTGECRGLPASGKNSSVLA